MNRSDRGVDDEAVVPSAWTPAQVASAVVSPANTLPLIGARDFARISDTLDIWDAWPVQDEQGAPFVFADGATLWMALGAPRFDDPDERHGHARIHLLRRDARGWSHLGPAMPEGFSPGSREWSGSAVFDGARGLTLYFTATGVRGEAEPSFGQRIFRAEATLGEDLRFVDWRNLVEVVVRDPRWYMASDAGSGSVGTIKAFRDPAYFRDPINGSRYLTFAASAAASDSAHNGVVGLAIGSEDGIWTIQPPIVSAVGLNNELERPHLIHRDGHYYLFWSTQRHVFAPDGPVGPTGLYGMVAERISGPWQPLNGSGLVFANPPEAPAQAYSWLVLPDLRVISFVDDWRAPGDASGRRFGATFAPEVRLALAGALAKLAG